MPLPEPENVCEIAAIENDADFLSFIEHGPSGITFVPERHGESDDPVHTAHAGDFAKWIKSNDPQTRVTVLPAEGRLIRHSSDFWFPLVYLANDVALPIYLNLVASYLYDKMSGRLRGDTSRVHVDARYRDQKAGVEKRFKFEGDADSFCQVAEKFELKDFFVDQAATD